MATDWAISRSEQGAGGRPGVDAQGSMGQSVRQSVGLRKALVGSRPEQGLPDPDPSRVFALIFFLEGILHVQVRIPYRSCYLREGAVSPPSVPRRSVLCVENSSRESSSTLNVIHRDQNLQPTYEVLRM